MPHSSLAVSDSRGKITPNAAGTSAGTAGWRPCRCGENRDEQDDDAHAAEPLQQAAPRNGAGLGFEAGDDGGARDAGEGFKRASAQWGVAPDNTKGGADTAAAAATASPRRGAGNAFLAGCGSAEPRRVTAGPKARRRPASSVLADQRRVQGDQHGQSDDGQQLPPWRAKRRGCIVSYYCRNSSCTFGSVAVMPNSTSRSQRISVSPRSTTVVTHPAPTTAPSTPEAAKVFPRQERPPPPPAPPPG